MQEERETTEAGEAGDESLLSSEAPDTVRADDQPPASSAEAETPEQDDLENLQPETDTAAVVEGEPAADSPTPADAAGEQPDGQVMAEPDDLVADANAVDPKISVSLLEAYLFSTHSPLTPGRLAELFNLESTKPIRKALRVLNEQYEQTGRCFRVEQVAGGFQLLTLPEHGEHLKALHQKEADAKLTKAALETLAIIAYKQPILRADVEAIRGVASGETIRSLMEKHLVKIAGRAEEPGRPILYGTTKRFLEVFGLNSLKDLPQPDSPQAKAQQLSRAAQALLGEGEAAPVQPAVPVEDAPQAQGTPGEADQTHAAPDAQAASEEAATEGVSAVSDASDAAAPEASGEQAAESGQDATPVPDQEASAEAPAEPTETDSQGEPRND